MSSSRDDLRSGPQARRHTPVRRVLRRAGTVVALLAASIAAAQTTPIAAVDYVPGFIQYVRWPGEEVVASWNVCIAAKAPDSPVSEGPRTARGRPLAIRQVAAESTLTDCHILDLTGAPPVAARTLLERARRHAILTLGEGEKFCTAGGVVCLRGDESGGGFEVNLSALQEAGLTANAQLLMLGRKRQTAKGGS